MIRDDRFVKFLTNRTLFKEMSAVRLRKKNLFTLLVLTALTTSFVTAREIPFGSKQTVTSYLYGDGDPDALGAASNGGIA